MRRIVVYCGTRNHYPRMVVAAKSLLCHTAVDRVFFLTEDDSFPEPLPDVVRVLNVSGQQWFPAGGANGESSWPYMAFIRLALGKLMPDEDTALYLDTDTLVLQNISPLWNVDLSGKLFGMVREDIGETPLELMKAFHEGLGIDVFQSDNPRPAYCIRPYYNSGVMLMNLAELRQSGMDDRLIHEIHTVKYPYPDQDAINLLCAGRIAELPQAYNVIRALAPDFPQDQVRIRHFCSDKPLWKSGLWQAYKRRSWEEVMGLQERLRGVYM